MNTPLSQVAALGAYVQSGAEVLQCTEHGVWVRKGEKRPDEPPG